MNPEDIKQHWTDCAREHGGDVKATTPGATAKMLEIDALWRHLRDMPDNTFVLEAGCGNGVNIIELAKRLSTFDFDGFDYVPEMVRSANQAAGEDPEHLRFMVGDVLAMDKILGIERYDYDVVFTDRCLINLTSWEDQKKAIKALADKVRPGGKLLMIENVVQGRRAQNRLRTHLGLPERPLMPPFNLFMDETELVQYLSDIGMQDIETEDFSSLHDLMLYVLLPALNQVQEWQYGDPLVKVATELSIKNSLMMPDVFGRFGQNILFSCRKPA